MSIPGGVVRFIFSASNTGGETINTGFWVFLNTPTPTQTELDTITNDVKGYWNTRLGTLVAYMYAGVSWQTVKSYFYNGVSPTAALQSSATLSANVGTLASAGSPIDTCLVVSLRTGLPGRSKRGRMYLPWHATVSPTTGQVSNTIITAYKDAFAGLFNDYNTAHAGYAIVRVRQLHRYR